jgi:hypothetical protein
MNERKQLHKIIWSLLLLFSSVRFAFDVGAVTHFAAMIASGLPIVLSTWSDRQQLDQSFLSILMMTICAVAVGIALAQWKVLNNGQPFDAAIPIIVGIVWNSHQNCEKRKV